MQSANLTALQRGRSDDEQARTSAKGRTPAFQSDRWRSAVRPTATFTPVARNDRFPRHPSSGVHKHLWLADGRRRPRFKPPQTPALTVTHRGLFGPLEVDVDPDWIREMLPEFSPSSRRGRRLRTLLRLHEEHYARLSADREALGVGPPIDEKNRIERELEAASKEACSLGGHSIGHVALQAASLMAAKFGSYHDCKRAPELLRTLLKVAAAA